MSFKNLSLAKTAGIGVRHTLPLMQSNLDADYIYQCASHLDALGNFIVIRNPLQFNIENYKTSPGRTRITGIDLN